MMKLSTQLNAQIAAPSDATLSLKGKVVITLRDSTGAVKSELEQDNLIVQVGKNFFANACIAASSSPFTNLAIGTSGTAAALGDTTLGAEVARQAFTSGVVANVVTMSTTFAAGVGTGALQEAGLFNNAVGGTMLSHLVFSTQNKGASDTLTIQWTVTVG